MSAAAWAKSGELVERKLGLQVAASPPKRELAIRTGIDESKLERAVRPAIERGIVRACRNRPPKNRGMTRATSRGGGSGDAGV